MVTLDFLAFAAYFVIPLAALTYKFWWEIPHLPLPVVTDTTLLGFTTSTLPALLVIILTFVACQQAYQVGLTVGGDIGGGEERHTNTTAMI